MKVIFLLPNLSSGGAERVVSILSSSMIENEKNGYIVDCGDSSGLSEKMHELASNEELAELIGANATYVCDIFSEDRIKEKWCDILQIMKQQSKNREAAKEG